MLENFDKNISIVVESFARRFGRRKVISTAIRGTFAMVAGVTIAQLTGLKQAFADCKCTCDDCWTQGSPCDDIGYSCPTDLLSKCPSGCSVCCCEDCGGWCNYASGSWISYQCTGLGTCGKGYRICTDCKCAGSCNHKCSCLSPIDCYNCCTPQQVKAEVRRFAALTH